jgi:hypothetical protein
MINFVRCANAFLLLLSVQSLAADLVTNETRMTSAPAWLKASRVDRVVGQIQRKLEWDIRRIRVQWYSDQAQFHAVHGFGATVLAFARRSDASVHIGPRVDTSNFDSVFGHELVHVILGQKYKDAVPKWLEEGLANYLAKRGEVDYAWIASRVPPDMRSLGHPFKGISSELGSGEEASRAHYQLSRALVEMIASRCRLEELLQLSVGKNLDTYLGTYCAITDLNADFHKWVDRKRKAVIAPKT